MDPVELRSERPLMNCRFSIEQMRNLLASVGFKDI